MGGEITQGVTNYPGKNDTPYLGLAKELNGGYYTNGTYTSRVLDAGSGYVTWDFISWSIGSSLSSDIRGLDGLWHLDGNWSDVKGHLVNDTDSDWTPHAKMGQLTLAAQAAVFNGTTAHSLVSDVNGLQSIEFWLKDDNANDGLLTVGGYGYLALVNRNATAAGFSNNIPVVYVNGHRNERLVSGWNHIAVVFPTALPNLDFDVGVANGDYLEGRLDELALYSRTLTEAEITEHIVSARRPVGGRVRLQVRSDTNNPPTTAFVGPGAQTDKYYENPSGSPIPLDLQGAGDRRYFQYRVYLDGDGNATPALELVDVRYNGGSHFVDDTSEEFQQGTFENRMTRWYGDEIALPDISALGPASINGLADLAIAGLWHLDESDWTAGVLDSSWYTKHGTAEKNPQPVIGAKVGPRCGSFGGTNDISLPAIDLGLGDFAVAAWIKTSTTTNRCAVLSSYDNVVNPYYALEFNGNGTNNVPGAAAFVVKAGGVTRGAYFNRFNLADGTWHHLMGVRHGDQIHLYVDGQRGATTEIGDGFGSVGNAAAYIAKYGKQERYFVGHIDEVVIYTRTVTEADIGAISGMGFDTKAWGTFTGPIEDVVLIQIWEDIAWGADAPYSRPHQAGETNVAALWPLDAINAGTVADISGHGFNGTVNGATLNTAGRFTNCLAFPGNDQNVTVPDAADPGGLLETVPLSVEAWVLFSNDLSRVIVDKRDANFGYRLATDGAGKPYFWVNGATATDFENVPSRQWVHMAGVYDGINIYIYVDGDLKGKAAAAGSPATTADLLLGLGYDGNGDFSGRLDQAAIYNRAFFPEEVRDHYKAGAVTLKFQAKSWISDPPPADFIGWDRSTNTYFTIAHRSDLVGSIDLGRYFQYKGFLTTDNGHYTPRFQGMRVDVSGYPSDHPSVEPATGYGFLFLGKLISFAEMLTTNTAGNVTYQISGDNGTNWYYWSGTQWDNVFGGGYSLANPWNVIHANIDKFYSQLYDKYGGTFKFKAYLNSLGNQQVELDQVDLGYSAGRVVVVTPNGAEVGDNAWLIGFPQKIRWEHAGTVSHNLKIEYSFNSGQDGSWVQIANGVSNTHTFVWTPPGESQLDEQQHVRIKISDNNDGTIYDMSDADFQLVWRFHVLAPNSNEYWQVGTSNNIIWEAATNLGTVVIEYAPDGATFNKTIYFGYPGTGGTTNFYPWDTTPQPGGVDETWLSETAKVKVRSLSGSGADTSDAYFTLGGIIITDPTGASAWKRGNTFPIKWTAAGAGSYVTIAFSPNGLSGPWTNITGTATNRVGTNSFEWTVNVQPTTKAMLRITSNSRPGLIGYSPLFTIADITILQPAGGETWLMGTTNTIVWLAAGASNLVNLAYSTNSGAAGTWTYITNNVVNLDAPQTNFFTWVVPPFPTRFARVKVEAKIDPTNLWGMSASDFNIAGVKILVPNGGERWDKGSTNLIRWAYQSAGSQATLQFSYDGGVTFTNVAPFSVNLVELAYAYTPFKPTIRGRAKIIADNPAPFTNVFDVSDADMTVVGVMVTAPGSNAVYTIGTTNSVNWVAAGIPISEGGDDASIYYASDGVNFTNLLATVHNDQNFPGNNTYPWIIPPFTDPSVNGNGRIRVVSGAYADQSPRFTVRGIKITTPAKGDILVIGGNGAIVWNWDGLSAGATVNMSLSTDGGANFPITIYNGWPLNAGAYAWSPVSPEANPTTNAMVRMVVASSPKPEDVGIEARSRPFVLQGMKITSPTNGAQWRIGASFPIDWLAANAGSPVDVLYAADGATYDLARPIRGNYINRDGTNSFPWLIEAFRQPSTNARVKVKSASAEAISPPFTVNGIRVTTPSASDIWAAGETNSIIWEAVGATPPYTVRLIKDGTVTNLIGSTTNLFTTYTATTNDISTNVIVRVTDSVGTAAESARFSVVGEPTILIVNPAAGAYWKVSETNEVKWSKGGKIEPPDFVVLYSVAPYTITNTIFPGGTVPYDPTNNTFSVPWQVEDTLGPAKIIVRHSTDPRITDVSPGFYIVGKFRVNYPNLATDTNLFANKTVQASWYSRGSVGAVNLYYSTDPLHATNSWALIASNVYNTGSGLGETYNFYPWTVPNLWDDDVNTVRFRVEQADRPGAIDDSDQDFPIRYYSIIWNVYDASSTNQTPLTNKLSVADSVGWSASGLGAPVLHKYPWGYFVTVWSREFFFDKIIFNWLSEPSRTIDVPMVPSSQAPDYRVMAGFLYDSTNDDMVVQAWLEKGSAIISDPTTCTIHIYDTDGNEVETLQAPPPPVVNGVFWLTVPKSLPRGALYFAKVDIEYSGVVYSSGVTFNLRLPSSVDQAQMIYNAVTNAEANILGQFGQVNTGVSNVNANVMNVSNTVQAFRTEVQGTLGNISNLTVGVSNRLARIDTNLTAMSNVIVGRLDLLTNAVGAIGPGGTNLLERVAAMQTDVTRLTPRILSRPTSIKLGATASILYRTRPSVSPAPAIRVTDTNGVQKYNSTMTEEIGGVGIYEHKISFTAPTFGPGDYTIECSDVTGRDKLGIKLTGIEIDDLAGLAQISNRLDLIDMRLTNILTTVTNIQTMLAGINAVDWSLLTNAATGVTNLQDRIVWADITNLLKVSQILTNRTAGMTWADITNMQATLGDVNARLTGLTNLDLLTAAITNVDWKALSNVNVLAVGITNILSGVDDLRGRINWTNVTDILAATTNLNAQVNWDDVRRTLGGVSNLQARINWTNITDLLSGMSNVQSAVSGLTNLPQVISVLTNVDWAAISNISSLAVNLTNILSGVSDLQTRINWTNVTDILDAATNLNAQVNWDDVLRTMTGVSNLEARINWTNIVTIMDGVSNVQVSLGGLTNLPQIISVLTNVNWGAISNIGSLSVSVTNILDSVTNIQDMVSGLTNLNDVVQILKDVNWDAVSNISTLAVSITNILDSVTNTQAIVGGLTNLPQLITVLTNVDWNSISNIGVLSSGVTNILTGVTNLQARINWTNVTDILTAATSLNARVNWSDILTIRAGVTSLQARINWTNVMDTYRAATNIQAMVQGLTNLDLVVAALTNIDLSTLMTTLTNVAEGVTNTYRGVTNVAPLVTNTYNGVTTLLARIAWTDVTDILAAATSLNARVNWTNIHDILNGVTNIQTALGALTNLDLAITSLTNVDWSSISNISTLAVDMTNLYDRVTNLDARVNWNDVALTLAGVSNLQTRINWTNVTDILAGVSDLQGRINWTNVTDIRAGVSNLQTAVAGLTSLTNLNSLATNLANISGLAISNLTVANVVLTNLAAMNIVLSNLNLTAVLTNIQSLASNTYLVVTNLRWFVTNTYQEVTNIQSVVSNTYLVTTNIRWFVTNTFTEVTNVQDVVSNIWLMLTDYTTSMVAKIAAISNALTGVAGDVVQARQKAGTAATAAQGAQSALQIMKADLGGGKLDSALAHLVAIRDALTDAQSNIRQVSNTLGTKNVADELDAIGQRINALGAISKDIKDLVSPTEGQVDREAIVKLNARMEEMQAMMKAVRQLMEEAVNKPVVVDWLEGAR
jgi:hypothetical protein